MSASIPSEERNPIYFASADVVAIREAVQNLAVTVLTEGTLVFGGHPAISPLILMVAQRLDAVRRVRIYQSKYFSSVVPRESIAFPHIVWTSAAGEDREQSLLVMREKMIRERRFSAGVFIGGMEGVEREYEVFTKTHPNVPTYPIASTGAAARILFEAGFGPADQVDREALVKDTAYGALFRRLLFCEKGPRSQNRRTGVRPK
jgi:hypothetical protein